MVDSIGLGSSTNSALQGVQRTSRQVDSTTDRLSTGLKIKDPLDGAEDFFTAQSLTNRAADLTGVKDQVGQAISTLQAADAGLEAIDQLADQARAIATAAKNTSDPTERQALADQFNQIRTQIDNLANDSSFGGTNLISSSPDNLDVALNEDGATLTIQGADTSSGGLGISSRTFASDADIDAAISETDNAISQVRSTSASLTSSSSTLQNRINFTESLSNTLEEGAANVTQADLNEEAASLLSLQTRQALGSNALRIATENERAVLGLFG
jgi:flagellin-like hook-associated protein FlgL